MHRALMRLYARQERRAAALDQYQVCVGWLERELGVEPEEETRQLYRQILRAAGSTAARAPTGSEARPAPGPAGARARAGAPLVGRDAERERLRAALAQMLDDAGHVVLVSGEAGIGKSRLIQEFAAEVAARGVRTLVGRCHETEQALPLHPWIDALRADRPALDAGIRERLGAMTSAQLSRVFPELPGSADHPVTLSAQPALLFDALAQLIGELVSGEPLVLVVEDLHWADAMSARFLAFLGRRVHALPVLVVGSMRPEELLDAPVLAHALGELKTEDRLTTVPLGPLSEDESRALVRALHPSARSGRHWDRITGEIWAVSEGNPFVIVESTRALLGESPEAWMRELRLARGVQDFVAARLDHLEELPRQVVAVAAAIGRDFPFALLPRAARIGERDAADAVEELVRRRIFDTVGDHLAFCHDWIRQVAYGRLLPPTRTVLHAAIGDALEALHRDRLDDVADQLGHHYSRAGNAQKAIPYLIRFAELAGQRYALDTALSALQQAIDAVDFLPEADRDRCRLDVALRQAFTLAVAGRQRECLDLLETHASLQRRVEDAALGSEYHFRLAMTHAYLGDFARSRPAGEVALREAERAQDDERVGKALYALAAMSYGIGASRDAVTYGTRAASVLHRCRAPYWHGLVCWNLAMNQALLGDFDGALETAERGDTIAEATGDQRLKSLTASARSWVHGSRGDTHAALQCARRAVEAAADPVAKSAALGALGHGHLMGGDATSAIKALEEAVESTPTRLTYTRALAYLGEAWLLGGDVDRAESVARRALEQARADGSAFNAALAERVLGRTAQATGDHARAEGRLHGALETFLSCEAAFEAAMTRLDLARTLASRAERVEAQGHFRDAVRTFEATGAAKRLAEARVLARSLGVTLPDA